MSALPSQSEGDESTEPTWLDPAAVSPGAQSLGGLKVLDLSRVLAGPLSTMILGDLGAEVLKVERPGTGDDTRQWGPPYDEAGQATYFQSVNRNKRSISIDMADPGDLNRLTTLAAEADILVENFRPGALDRFGLGYDALSATNSGLIYCSVTGFGSGAGAELPGYDLLIQAMGGLMSITGEKNGPPQKVGVALVDVIAGLFATVGVLAALRHREETGEGQHVEVNLLSSLLAALVNQGSAYTLAGVVAERMGNAHPSISPYDLYAAKGGEVVLAVGNDRQFAALCKVLGAADLAHEDRFSNNYERVSHRAELRAELEARLAARTPDEWVALLKPVGVPAGEVNDIAGAFELAESLGLEPVVRMPRAGGDGEVGLTRNPIGLSATPPTYRSGPPPLA